MIFLWILIGSLVLYVYYGLHVRGQLLAAHLGPESAAGELDGPPPPVADMPLLADTPVPEVAEESDYLDMDALTRPAHPPLPAIPLKADPEGVYRGGAAGAHPNVFVSGRVDLDGATTLAGDRRQAPRRQQARREEDLPRTQRQRSSADRRLAPRRVWLRRAEDQDHLDLVDIQEAARILSTTPEMVDRWILSADLPFYMVTRGAVREKRFDRIELLGWLGAEDVMEARTRAKREEDG